MTEYTILALAVAFICYVTVAAIYLRARLAKIDHDEWRMTTRFDVLDSDCRRCAKWLSKRMRQETCHLFAAIYRTHRPKRYNIHARSPRGAGSAEVRNLRRLQSAIQGKQ